MDAPLVIHYLLVAPLEKARLAVAVAAPRHEERRAVEHDGERRELYVAVLGRYSQVTATHPATYGVQLIWYGTRTNSP